MIRHLPSDIFLECKGNPSHTFPWYGQHKCPKCDAALPVQTARPQPLPHPQDDPTALICALNEAIDRARRAQMRWRISGKYYHHGVEVAVTWEGDNSQAGRTEHQGKPYHVTIAYRLDSINEHFASRQQAFTWLVDHLSTVPLWPWWTFQKER